MISTLLMRPFLHASEILTKRVDLQVGEVEVFVHLVQCQNEGRQQPEAHINKTDKSVVKTHFKQINHYDITVHTITFSTPISCQGHSVSNLKIWSSRYQTLGTVPNHDYSHCHLTVIHISATFSSKLIFSNCD